MSAVYCDTSVLVAALAAEANSAAVQAWLVDHKSRIAVSAWVGTELSSALAMKKAHGYPRRSRVVAGDARVAYVRDSQLIAVPIIERDFVVVSDLLERKDLGLRSGDALRLAILMRHGLSLATLNRKFADAARVLAVELALELPRIQP